MEEPEVQQQQMDPVEEVVVSPLGGEPTVDIKWHKAGQLSETLVLGEDCCVILEVSNCWCAETVASPTVGDDSSSSSSSNDSGGDRDDEWWNVTWGSAPTHPFRPRQEFLEQRGRGREVLGVTHPFDRGKRFAPCAAWRVMGFVPGGGGFGRTRTTTAACRS